MSTSSETPKGVLITTQSQRDRILQVASIPCRLSLGHDLRYGSSISTPVSDLGDLEYLPVEIICEIARLLDISSLFSLSHVNRRGRQVITSIPELALVTKLAHRALRTLFDAKLAQCFTITDLSGALSIENCHFCDNFGGHLYLPSLTRCCINCRRIFQPLPISALEPYVSEQQLRDMSIPVMQAHLTSFFSERFKNQRVWLVDSEAITRIQVMGGLPALKLSKGTRYNIGYDHNQIRYQTVAAPMLPHVDPRSWKAQHGVMCHGCRVGLYRAKWFRMPKTDVVAARKLMEVVYSNEGLIKHFAECAEAQEIWASSKDGTVEPQKPEWLLQREEQTRRSLRLGEHRVRLGGA